MDFNRQSQKVINAEPTEIKVGSKTYKVKQVSYGIHRAVDQLTQEAFVLNNKAKGELTLRQAKRISRKLNSLHAKTAAMYILGNWYLLKPLYWLTWRLLMWGSPEAVFRINAAGANDSSLDFFLANWQLTKAQQDIFTQAIGRAVSEYQERKESAQTLAQEDGSPTKPESK